MELKVRKLMDFAKLPTRSYNSAGYDLYSANNYVIEPGQLKKVHTDIAVEIPEGYVGVFRDRSSLGSKGIVVTAGVIDSDYRGELMVCLLNLSKNDFIVKVGDKIVQMLILPAPYFDIVETDTLSETGRGERGFGSTGK